MKGQETEVKYYVRDLKQVEKRIRALGGHSIQARVYEVNLRYDLPDGSLRQGGKVLRLRQDEQARLTYKGPSLRSDGVLSRVEFETALDDFDSGKNILEALGYLPVATYEKYRSTYELGELHIMLDELPYGDFVEIEGPDIPALQKTSEDLGLDFSAAIPASYLVLFEGLCQKRGLDPAQLTFSALEDLHVKPGELSVRPADEE